MCNTVEKVYDLASFCYFLKVEDLYQRWLYYGIKVWLSLTL